MIQKVSTSDEVITSQQQFCRLQQAQRLTSLGSLAGSIAHDFNTLLVSILGHTELALGKLSEDDPARENIEEIRIAASSAAELSNQMMLYSDKAHCEVKPTDLNKVINDVGHLLSVSISKNIRLNYELSDAIPPAEASSLQIQQVVMNLIVNASDAIGENSGSITISSGTEKLKAPSSQPQGKSLSGHYCYVKVTDTGCGMDSATQEKVFDPYFTTKASGHGLGMAAVSQIVESRHGAIQFETSPGSGTTFTVWFPCSQQPDELSSERRPKLGSGTILVVDDEPGVLTVTKAMLEHHGFDVLTAENGQQCIEILSNGKPVDVVLLDLTMPGMSARDILQKGRQLQPNLRVVLCSGYSEREAMTLFDGKGLSGFIKKPFSLHEILTVLLRVQTAHTSQPPQVGLVKKSLRACRL